MRKILCITNKIFPNTLASSDCIYKLLGNDNVDYFCSEDFYTNYKNKPNNLILYPNERVRIYKKINNVIHNEVLSRKISSLLDKLHVIKNISHESLYGDLDKTVIMNEVDKIIDSYDYIVSVSMSMVNHMIASWIKERYPNIKWIVYEVDPYVYNSTHSIKKIGERKNKAKELYKNADYFFYMPGIKQYNNKMGYFPPYHENSIELELPKLAKPLDIDKRDVFDKKYINIVYTGVFYDKIRNPEKTLEMFSKLPIDFVLHIFGSGCNKVLNKYKNIMKEKLQLHGYSSNDECRQALINADVLVAIGNTVENQIPSKIFDYFATGKPIINIKQIDNDTSEPYMIKYGNAINVKDDNYDLSIIQDFISNKHDITFDNIAERMPDCLLDNIRTKFLKTINKV